MKITKKLVLVFLLIFSIRSVFAQCDSTVINLTGRPDSVWNSNGELSRNNSCCGGNTCRKFVVTLDPNAAGISFQLTGALPNGSLSWILDCGVSHPINDTVCIPGPGTHRIVFCKTGANTNGYLIQSIPRPTFPHKSDSLRMGCDFNLITIGGKAGTVHWNSIHPGVRGAYNYLIDSVSNPAYPFINPNLLIGVPPPYITFEVSAFPASQKCVTQITVKDTVHIKLFTALTGSVTPNPASFCSGGSGVTLTASGIGGGGNYSYKWYNASNVLVGTGPSYFATLGQNYTVRIDDAI